MAYLRSRLVDNGVTPGSRTLYGSVTTGETWHGSSLCKDVLGNSKGDNLLEITKTQVIGGTLSGTRVNQFEGQWASWNKFPFSIRFSQFDPIAFTMNESAAALKAMVYTNPGRHEVLAPAFLLELRDLPKMFRFCGRLLSATRESYDIFMNAYRIWTRQDGIPFSRGLTPAQVRQLIGARLLPEQQDGLSAAQIIAAANLAIQFGWAPVIRDLKSMIDFQSAVARRRKEINRLYSGNGLKRKFRIQDDKDVTEQVVTLDSVGGAVEGWVKRERFTKRWVTIAYKPLYPALAPPNDQQLMNQIMGLSVHGVIASAWEVLPWSWLIDWFTNFGDILDYSNNEIATTKRVNVMSHTSVKFKTPYYHVEFWDGSKDFSPTEDSRVTKTRSPNPPGWDAFSVRLPFLTAGQLSILGSLALLRGLR